MAITFRRTTAMTANGTADPVNDGDWIYRRVPWPAQVFVANVSTDTNVLGQVTIGSDVQQQESPVPGGGTAGVFPREVADFDEFLATTGDQIRVQLRETAGGTPSVMTVIRLVPLI